MVIVKKYILFFIIFALGKLHCQEVKQLFESDSVLNITIKLHLKDVINDIKMRDYHEAQISYLDANNQESLQNIKIKVRGKSRADANNCSFPPLEINFKKNKLKNSIFEGQNKLKLVTHCKNLKEYNDYILEEYMTYKLYEVVSPKSFKSRLCEITYIDLDKSNKTITKVGILIENINDVAKRNDMVVYKDSIKHQDFCNRTELDKLMMFQFMIGNLDWAIEHRHNIKLISPRERGLPIAVPYDFDHAGIIYTSYAAPPESANLSSVRLRLFRGLCRSNYGYDKTLDLYQKLKPDFFELIKKEPYLSDKSKKSMEKYLESFYDILDDPKKVNKKIITACRITHDHLYETN